MLQRWASLPNSSSISICRRALSTYADEVIDAYTKRLLYPNEAGRCRWSGPPRLCLTFALSAVLSPMTTPVRRCTVTRRRFPRAFLIAFSAVPSRAPQGGSVTVPDGMRRRHGKGSYAFALPSVLAAKIKQCAHVLLAVPPIAGCLTCDLGQRSVPVSGQMPHRFWQMKYDKHA